MTPLIFISRDLADLIDFALSKAIRHQIAFANDEPFKDDPRWSPWTRFQKPVADRCGEAREALMDARDLSPDDPVAVVREVLIQADDMIPCGEEPYTGWSLVLAERIVAALKVSGGGTDREVAVKRDSGRGA